MRGRYTTYSVDTLERSSWHHWFNLGDVSIRTAISGNIINSYFASDAALDFMMVNDSATNNFNGERYYRGSFTDWRTPGNLSDRPSLFRRDATGVGPGSGSDKMTRPAGQVSNPFADINIDAAAFGWSKDGGDDLGHSCLFDDDYPRIYSWFEKVFTVTDAAVSIGRGVMSGSLIKTMFPWLVFLVFFSPVWLCAVFCPLRRQTLASCLLTLLYGLFVIAMTPLCKLDRSTSGRGGSIAETQMVHAAVLILSIWLVHGAKLWLARKFGWWGAAKAQRPARCYGFPVVMPDQQKDAGKEKERRGTLHLN